MYDSEMMHDFLKLLECLGWIAEVNLTSLDGILRRTPLGRCGSPLRNVVPISADLEKQTHGLSLELPAAAHGLQTCAMF